MLIAVAQRTATSLGLQTSSIIRVTDHQIKQELAEVCNQEYVARVPELFIFIADLYRNSQIAKEKIVIPRGLAVSTFLLLLLMLV